MKSDGNRALLAWICGWGAIALAPCVRVEAQTVRREREAVVTGPRGRTIDRRVEVERGPGMVDRRVQVTRPNATLQRQVQMQGGPPRVVRGGPMVVERNVYVNPRPSSSWAFGFGVAPMLTVPLWAPPLPPPVVIAAPPVVVAPQPGAVAIAQPPQRVVVAQPSPLDPVALAAQRLQSHHAGSRREGAETLGRLGDPRAIPALVDTLKHDSSKDVRIAAAHAVGLIGGPEAEVVLERCIIYEKKQEVRDAAAIALRDLRARRPIEAPAAAPLARRSIVQESAPRSSVVPKLPATSPPPSPRPSPFRPPAETVEPELDGPANEATPFDTERTPPPPPTPVEPR
ncbi:MAG: HEAT repeat domain-containing protein [Isosphaeraceae bacterium]